MNQFANIGSMFPGAQFKPLRDKAKEVLTASGQPEIVGLVIKNGDDTTIIEQGKIWDKMSNPIIAQEHFLQIAQIECEYWKNVCDKDPGGYGIEGMCAAGNIIAAVVMGLTPEEFKAKKEAP